MLEFAPTPPSPEMLGAMIRGEQDVIESLIASDPVYQSYIRRHRAERVGKPMGVAAFYSARNELDTLYASTTPALRRRAPDLYATQVGLIRRLERELVSE